MGTPSAHCERVQMVWAGTSRQLLPICACSKWHFLPLAPGIQLSYPPLSHPPDQHLPEIAPAGMPHDLPAQLCFELVQLACFPGNLLDLLIGVDDIDRKDLLIEHLCNQPDDPLDAYLDGKLRVLLSKVPASPEENVRIGTRGVGTFQGKIEKSCLLGRGKPLALLRGPFHAVQQNLPLVDGRVFLADCPVDVQIGTIFGDL